MARPEFRITKESSITFVELPATSGGKLDGKIAGDIYSRLKQPPRAIPVLHSVANQAGYSDVVSIAPQYNPESKLTKEDRRRIMGSDILALSSITRTIPQTEELAREYKKSNPAGCVLAGGVHVTALPEECLNFADIIVRGEGEETLNELLVVLEKNGSPEGVRGVSYKNGDRIVHEPNRELLSEQKLADLPKPVYSETVRKGVRMNTARTSRGCTGRCKFCFVPITYGDCYRRKSNEANIAQLKVLPPGVMFIIDDYFMGKPKQTKELLEMMKEEGLNTNSYIVQLRAQAGLIPGAPQLLREAGVRLAAVGFESQSDRTLKLIGKTTTAAQNREGARALREAGIRIHGMFILGLDEDTPESVRETLEFAKQECDTVQIFAPGPLPGTEFTQEMERQGRILTKNYSLYDGLNVLIRPKNFTPYKLQQTIINMHKEFYSFKLAGNKIKSFFLGSGTWSDLKYDLMTRAYAQWIAIRSLVNDPQTQKHLADLKAWS